MLNNERSIDELGLSVRSSNALHRAGIHTIEELQKLTEDKLFQINNLGKKSIDEIMEVIEEIKFSDHTDVYVPEAPIKANNNEQLNEIDKMMSIDVLNMSVRSSNSLHRAGIHTVEELLKMTEDELSQIRNLGARSKEEILLKMAGIDKDTINNKYHAKKLTIENFNKRLKDGDVRHFIRLWLKNKQAKLTELSDLSSRSFNTLIMNGYEYIFEIAFMPRGVLMKLSRMDFSDSGEIYNAVNKYILGNSVKIISDYNNEFFERQSETYNEEKSAKHNNDREKTLEFVKANDIPIDSLDIPNRCKNRLRINGCHFMSDIIFMSRDDLIGFGWLSTEAVEIIFFEIKKYFDQNKHRLDAYLNGDVFALKSNEQVSDDILDLYKTAPFAGFSFNDFKEKLNFGEIVSDERLKMLIGKLIAEKKLEYVDFRCYKVYESFEDFLGKSQSLDDKRKYCVLQRLEGKTYDELGTELELTRERVRQIVEKSIKTIQKENYDLGNDGVFDEDYYRYFYETYNFEMSDAEKWLNISPKTLRYLRLFDAKNGNTELIKALDDTKLGAGLRLKIKNYLNRNKLYIDGKWVELKRPELEKALIKKFCASAVSMSGFARMYNEYLRSEGVEYEEKIYLTENSLRSRLNRIAEARFVLYSLNETFRYYDIDGQDYSELLETLDLEAYRDIELSTLKFFDDYPELMARYDIHDHYELHNLLKKIIKDGSFNDFHCGRTPTIRFGSFDRTAAFIRIIKELGPLTKDELYGYVRAEYGFEYGFFPWKDIDLYFHQGVYSAEKKQMSAENLALLGNALTDDFYHIEEVKNIYRELDPDADTDEINSYNLKRMGFNVYSRDILKNHASMDEYFYRLFTENDITDLAELRKRYVYTQLFSQKFMELKRSGEIIEFEPDKIITLRKLEAAGLTAEMIAEFCDRVWDFVEDGAYFSIRSLRKAGFDSELFDFGFSDWFYANLFYTDDRFSISRMYGALITHKGAGNISIKTFEEWIVNNAGVIDLYDMYSLLTDDHGCTIEYKSDIVAGLSDTKVYYDDYLDRLYADQDMYYAELEMSEG